MKLIKIAFCLFGCIVLASCSGKNTYTVNSYDISTTYKMDELENIAWGSIIKSKFDEIGISDAVSFRAYQETNFKAECYIKTKSEEVYVLLEGHGEGNDWEIERIDNNDNHSIVYYAKNQPNYNNEYTLDIYDYKTKELLHEMNNESRVQKEKTELLSKLQATLKEYENIDILTLTTGGYSASIQIKKDISREDAIKYSEELKPVLQTIVDKYDLEIIDSNYQLILLIDQDGNTNQ